MSNINNITCAADAKNTGNCKCSFDPKNIVGQILLPVNARFTEAQLADEVIAATFSSRILADKAARMYPIMGNVGFTDNSEDAVQETFGFGQSETVREGNYKWLPNFRVGGIERNNALRSFNGLQSQFGVIFIDAENYLIGTIRNNATTGQKELAPIPLDEIYTYPWKVADGSKAAQYRTMFSFKPSYINELIAYKKVDPTFLFLPELQGLQNINLLQKAVTATTVTVDAVADCGDSLFDTYGVELANVAAWQVQNLLTGAAITVTGVTRNTGLKSWVLALDAADTDLPATGGKYTVSLVAPSVLAATPINVVGYEGVNKLQITRPA